MRQVWGPDGGPVAVLLPGTASTAEFVGRAFGPPLARFGYGLVSADPPRDGSPEAVLDALDGAARRFRPALVGGVSLGAHLAVRWAAGAPGHRPAGLLLVMPAWTGAPDPIAGASAATAEEVATRGAPAVLRRILAATADAPATRWVADELAAAWPAYTGAELAATLRATAASAGPSPEQLAAVTVPCGVVALRDDPLHPARVARQWAATLPRASLIETGLGAVGADRATLGRAALLAYLRARSASPRPFLNQTFAARVL